MTLPAEKQRLKDHAERKANWKKWGPYLSERAWATVREDYSLNGEAWDYFPHDHARSRAYRWNEDGIGGLSDRYQWVCFAYAFWNGRDPILKERLFGLSNPEGNHGEDVKEYYFYLDNTPTHSYMKMLYKYPQEAFPYNRLVSENARRTSDEPEYELLDTGIFDQNRYFDILIEYAKADEDDLLIKATVTNRGAEEARCDFLPTVWFRNTWDWGYPAGPWNDMLIRPQIRFIDDFGSVSTVEVSHPLMGIYYLYAENQPEWIFTENETNLERLYHQPNKTPYVKDAFHHYLIHREKVAINPEKIGTKAAALYHCSLKSGESYTARLRLVNRQSVNPFTNFKEEFLQRQQEAEEFYASIQNVRLSAEEKNIQRQAFAGMLWSKQLYYYDYEQWMFGDQGSNSIPIQRETKRNRGWEHLVNFDVLSMPDKWEYPWYASWDLTFHCIVLVLIDPDFAKRQLTLMTREWYMHPNGQLPAYEWNFNDVNPPTLAWAAWRVYKIDGKQSGHYDRRFLEDIFHKLLLNFTWWVNRKDEDGHNVFQGGFLGLDNISLFDRSTLSFDGHIDQADGTAWMSFYCILLMKIALELAKENPIYQDSATKFFEHFLRIARALHDVSKKGHALWNQEDGFFYDALHLISGEVIPLKVRSLVGLIPLLAVETIEPDLLDKMPVFATRMEWFTSRRPDYARTMACVDDPGMGRRRLMSLLTRENLLFVLRYLLDENEFLSDFGIRSLSKFYQKHPYVLSFGGQEYKINYQPGASQNKIYGGNSNWRGPIWFPLNFLIIESLQKFHYYYGDHLQVECPTGSGRMMHLGDVAKELSRRLIKLFLPNEKGMRPLYGAANVFHTDPCWKDLLLFYEYFHGDSGVGLGASHQTGWTALVAKLLQQAGTLKDGTYL
jgi:hypothetical protein